MTYNGAVVGAPAAPGPVLPAGYYNVVVENLTGVQGVTFELSGPGVSLSTDVDAGEVATETDPVTLLPNSVYEFQNVNLPSSGLYFSSSGVVGSSAPTSGSTAGSSSSTGASGGTNPAATKTVTTPSPEPVAPPLRGTLTAVVSAADKLSFVFKGKAVATLAAGRYSVHVSDKSHTAGFVLQGLHGVALTVTTAPFVGSRSTSVTLSAGQWVYYPTILGTKTYFIVIN
jgi:hypothetical protein